MKIFMPRIQRACVCLVSQYTLIPETVFKKDDFRLKVENFHACAQCRKGKLSKSCRQFFLIVFNNINCLQDIFCDGDIVALSGCFCHGGYKYISLMKVIHAISILFLMHLKIMLIIFACFKMRYT